MAVPRALILLVIPPSSLPLSAYLFMSPPAQQAEIETLVDSWGFGEIESLSDGAMALPGLVRLELHAAEILDGLPLCRAVVFRENSSGKVFSVFLCQSLETAGGLARSSFGGQLSSEIVKLRAMPPINPQRGRIRWRLASDIAPTATSGLTGAGRRPSRGLEPPEDQSPLGIADYLAHHRAGGSFGRRNDPDERLTLIAGIMAQSEDLSSLPGEWSARICPRCQDHPLHVDASLDGVAPSGERICVACARLARIPRAYDDPGPRTGGSI